MPKAIREGKDASQGHMGCCFFDQQKPSAGNSNGVYNETFSIAVRGSAYTDHTKCKCCSKCTPISHPGRKAVEGSPTVFIGGKPLHRDGDAISCGDAADNGSKNLFCDDGPALDFDPLDTIGYVINGVKLDTVSFIAKYDYKRMWNPVKGEFDHKFQRGYPVTPEKWVAYTEIMEENTKRKFKNSPTSGAVLPPDAPPPYSKPIPITSTDKPKGAALLKGLSWRKSGNNYTGIQGQVKVLPPASPEYLQEFKVTLEADLSGLWPKLVPGMQRWKGMSLVDGPILVTYKGTCTNCT